MPGVASGILFSVRNRVWGLLDSVHLKAILQGYYIIFIPIFQLGMSKLLLLRVTLGTLTCILAWSLQLYNKGKNQLHTELACFGLHSLKTVG